jgi:hypothetical protein
MSIQKAIELGQDWMKNSKDMLHDYSHASDVEQEALNICKDENIIDEHFISLLRVACWWHDSYKAIEVKWPLITYFTEGYESEKIVRERLKDLLSPEDLDVVGHAVRYHNSFPLSLLLTRKYNGITRILIEADNIDCLNDSRLRRKYENPSIFLRLASKIYYLYIKISYRILPMFKYTQRKLRFFKLKGE